MLYLSAGLSGLSAEPTGPLSYEQALQRAYENAPEVKKARADLSIAEKELEKADFLVSEAPELEASITRGTSKDSIEVLDYNYSALVHNKEVPVRGWELGLSQKVELGGQRGLRIEQKTAEKDYFEARETLTRLEARAKARELYIQAALLQEWEEHLTEHLNRFYRLRARFGAGYIDRRLGNYSLVALNMGIQTLKSERDEVSILKRKLIRELSLMVGLAPESIKLQSADSIKMPGLPPLEELSRDMEQGAVLKEREALLKSREKEQDLESRKLWPSPSLFLYGGERTSNTDAMVSVYPGNRETYMRAGIRLPLGFLGPERKSSDIAAQRAEKARVELETATDRSRVQLKASYQNYESLKGQYLQMNRFLIQAERFLPALDQALMGRRISYFEFWGEHERYHALFQRSLDVRLNAAKALSEMELLTGRVLDGEKGE
tara:strand:+ start:297816 stop:299123 length:1308 start_codon:yes stop_codon:yes gene_type:complete